MPPPSQDIEVAQSLHRAGRLEEARQSFEAIMAREPESSGARRGLGLVWYDLGVGCQRRGLRAEAEVAYRKAWDLAPVFAKIQGNLGMVLQESGRLEEAAAAYAAALRIQPDFFEAHNNLGNVLAAQNKPEEAVAAFRKALEIRPDSPVTRYNLSLAQLLRGDLPGGWENFEYRWVCTVNRGWGHFLKRLWTGQENLGGRRILIHAEQGLGDTLQFVRYLPLLRERGADVYLEVQPALKSLLLAQAGANGVHARGEAPPEFDFQFPLLSLPRAFATDLDTIPASTPYLAAPAEKVAKWAQALPVGGRPQVGLTWSGSSGHTNDRNRSIPLADFKQLFHGLPGSFFSLQKEVRNEDAAVLTALPEVANLAPDLADFTDTAAIIANLDLVITVDTSIVHLAGAMGKPTWLLLPFVPDWRWLFERKDSPWYPSLRLFRQPAAGDWKSVLAVVRSELERRPLRP